MAEEKKLKATRFGPSSDVVDLTKGRKGFGVGSGEVEIIDEEAFKEVLSRRRRLPELTSIIRVKQGK